jgi:4-amino-4-deoxy-L-arabinose transferase-like glycosyltransferase
MMTYFPKKPLVLVILIISICVSFFFAVYKDSVSPPCFNSDEAAFAYNAYSILQTGADEYGNVLPLRLKSFGDYKMPLYSYLSIPFIATFGLNELGARALNIFIASLFPIIIYFVVKELFEKEEIAAIAAFLISVSLGKGIMERQAHEGILASFLIFLATFFFVRFLKKETYANAIFFVLFLFFSLFAYQSSRIFAVFFFVYTLLHFFIQRKGGSARKFFIIILVISVGLFAITDVIYKPARVQNLFLTNTAGFTLRINELIGEGGSRIAYNKLTEGVKEFATNQMTYYSPQFLAIDGDSNYRFGFPGMGPMTIVEYLFIFIGIYFLFRNSERWRYLFLGLIFVAPITAALSWNGLSLTRAIFLVLTLLIVASYGGYYFVIQFKKRKFFLYLIAILFFVEIICLFYSWDFYLNHYPKRAIVTQSWECGYSELGDYIKQNYNKFDRFYITQKNGEPYIFLLFYLKYPPQLYQKQASLSAPDQFGFGQVAKFDKFNFSVPSSAFQQNHVAIIGYPDDFNNIPLDKTKLKKIVVNNLPIFWIYEK